MAASTPGCIMHHARSASRSTKAAERPVSANSVGIVPGPAPPPVPASAPPAPLPPPQLLSLVHPSQARSRLPPTRSPRLTCAPRPAAKSRRRAPGTPRKTTRVGSPASGPPRARLVSPRSGRDRRHCL
eukprot:scaffold20628_cov65-Phaeocystis_antarctica.AAC.4